MRKRYKSGNDNRARQQGRYQRANLRRRDSCLSANQRITYAVREPHLHAALCDDWNTIQSGDYTIAEFVPETYSQ